MGLMLDPLENDEKIYNYQYKELHKNKIIPKV
jgi:hypothetical protein